ncbi:hypothetical protein EON63_06840 [archaeon]|nr:MAG: hypothetical protein EON63_06840 [archaeon]
MDVSHNRLQSLDFVLDCMFLRVLRCHHNSIESLMPLENHSKLEEIWISNNKIDWAQFMYLQSNKELRILVKNHNPCDDKVKCNEFILNILPSLQCLDSQQSSDTGTMSHRHTDDIDLKVMLTQARAQLKRDHSSQNLTIENISLQGDSFATERSRSHSAKTSRGMSRTSESEHSHTPDGRHSASSSHKHRHPPSSLKQLQKKQSNSTQNLHQHFEEDEEEGASAGEGLVATAQPAHQPTRHTSAEHKKKSTSSSNRATKSLSDVNTDLDQMLKDMQSMGNKVQTGSSVSNNTFKMNDKYI